MKVNFMICIPTILSRFLVKRLAYIFCYFALPRFSVLSLPAGILDTLLMQAVMERFGSRFLGLDFLRSIGLGLWFPPCGGRPQIRREAGHVFRWGEVSCVEGRDGVGWGISRKDDVQTSKRVEVLLKLRFQKRRSFH